MGGADEAMGNLFEIGGGKPHLSPHFARVLPGYIAEDAAKCADAVPAGLQGDVDDWKVGVAQKRNGALHPAGQQISVRGYTEGIAKRSCEMRLRGTADFCKA